MISTERGSYRGSYRGSFREANEAIKSNIAFKTSGEQSKGELKAQQDLPKNASDFRIYIYEITESTAFGGAILFVILANTVALLAQTNESLVLRGGWYFSALDNIFLSIYIVEVVMKIYAVRFKFFKIGWNIMDFVIVVLTTVDFLMPLIVKSTGVLDVAAIFRVLRMFRAIRALRALRVLRTIRFLKNLQVILTTILRSFSALSTIVMLQVLVLYVFAVIGRGLFSDVSKKKFGNLPRSFFTLFQLITLDDWHELYSKITKKDGRQAFLLVYLILYIVLENFIFMNLFAAVLVDNFQRAFTAVERRKDDSETKQRTLFRVELEDSDRADDEFLSDSASENSQGEGENREDMQEEVEHRSIDDYFHRSLHSKRRRELYQEYFTLLGTLEFNIYHTRVQKKLLDDLVDIAVTIPDVPEEVV